MMNMSIVAAAKTDFYMTQLPTFKFSGNTRHLWRNSLSAKFVWVQLFIAFIIIASTIGVFWLIQRDQLLQQQQELNRTYGQVVISRLQEISGIYEAIAVSMAGVAGQYLQQPQQLQELQKVIPALLDRKHPNDLLAGGGIWPEPRDENTLSSKSLFWFRDTNNTLIQTTDYNRNAVTPYHNEEWYRPTHLYPANVAFWSPAYRDPVTGTAMVTASVPIRADHRFIGAATIDISLAGINELFHGLSRDLSGYIIALDYRNQLLSLPQGLQQHLQITPSQVNDIQILSAKIPAFTVFKSALQTADDAIIVQAQKHPLFTEQQLRKLPSLINDPNKLMQAIVQNGPQHWPKAAELVDLVEIQHDPLLGEDALVSVFLMPDTFWKILVVTPLSQLHHNAYLLAGKVGLFLVIIQLLAMLLLSLIQKRIFIAPITKMASTLKMQNLAELELLQNTRHDEFGELAGSFLERVRQLETEMSGLYAENLALEQQLQVQESAQIKLLNLTEQLGALQKFSQHIIHMKDLNGGYIWVNDKYCELLGREREQLLGHTDQQIFPALEFPLTVQHEQRVLQSRAPFSAEEPLHIHHGGNRPFFVTRFPLKNELGEINGIGAIGFDLSGVKRSEVQLQGEIDKLQQQLDALLQQIQQQKMQQRYFAKEKQLANQQEHQLQQEIERLHHLEQPLPRLLTLLISTLSKRLDQLSAALYHHASDEAIPLALQQAEALRHLLPLVNYQRNEIQALAIDEFFDDLLIFMAPELATVEVLIEVDKDLRLLAAGKSWQHLIIFYRLISNIANDAFPTSQHDKQLRIALTENNGHVLIRLTDNGNGMTQSQVAAIQQQWQQHSTNGTLATVYHYLNTQLNGALSLACAPTKGCCITIQLPAIQPE